MKYNIRGDKLAVTDAINSYVEGKLGKLDKYFRNDEIRANVLLKVRGANRQIIEVTIPTEKFILRYRFCIFLVSDTNFFCIDPGYVIF